MKENEGVSVKNSCMKGAQDKLFWIKDTKFPIDIIWINGTGSVVHIEENLASPL